MQPARWWSRGDCACNLCRAVAGPPCWETFDDGQYASVHGCDSLPAHGSGKSYAGHGRGGGGFLRDAGAYQGGSRHAAADDCHESDTGTRPRSTVLASENNHGDRSGAEVSKTPWTPK